MKYDRKKLSVGLLSLLVVLACAVSGTLAWISTTSGTVTNTFTPAKVTTEVDENIEGPTKKNVAITNTGDVDAYIRAAIVVNLVDEAGNVSAQQPVRGDDKDYIFELAENSGWNLGSDDYYYYESKVAPNKTTEILLKQVQIVEETNTIPADLHLQVTIIAEGIQADGMDTSVDPSIPAVQSVWPVTVTDGIMKPDKNS